MENQKEIIKKHLKSGKTITSMQAFKDFGITRLAAIIFELRDKFGMTIHSNEKTVKNRQKRNVSVCEYSLKKNKNK